MPPKFQSSFIPKGPITASSPVVPSMRKFGGERSLFSTISYFIFTLSIILALGVFSYRIYLEYRIEQMNVDLAQARATLEPETIQDLSNLDNRIVSTKTLISNHKVLTPFLEFLENSTPTTVRFTSFDFKATDKGLELAMRGEARGYAALALQADIFNESRYFKNSVFSGLTLNQRGDVEFSFESLIVPELLTHTAIPTVPPESELELGDNLELE